MLSQASISLWVKSWRVKHDMLRVLRYAATLRSKSKFIQPESGETLHLTTVPWHELEQVEVNLAESSLNPLPNTENQSLNPAILLRVIPPLCHCSNNICLTPFGILDPLQVNSCSFSRTDTMTLLPECSMRLFRIFACLRSFWKRCAPLTRTKWWVIFTLLRLLSHASTSSQTGAAYVSVKWTTPNASDLELYLGSPMLFTILSWNWSSHQPISTDI